MARLVVEKPRAKVEKIEFGQKKREKAAADAKKTRTEKLFAFDEESPEDKVSFGTKSHRLMFPLYVPDTRFGQAVMPKGLQFPDVGPGRYENEDHSSLLHGLETRVETKKGTVMGGRTDVRFPKNQATYLDNPAPDQYLAHPDWTLPANPKPFNTSVPPGSRFPQDLPKSKRTPGPGTYQHDVERDRHVLYHHTFGGPRCLKVAAEKLIPKTNINPLAKTEPFIRHGYSYQPDIHEKHADGYLEAFYTGHGDGSVDNRLRILRGNQTKPLLQKKAYLSRYYDDAPPPGRTKSLQPAE